MENYFYTLSEFKYDPEYLVYSASAIPEFYMNEANENEKENYNYTYVLSKYSKRNKTITNHYLYSDIELTEKQLKESFEFIQPIWESYDMLFSVVLENNDTGEVKIIKENKEITPTQEQLEEVKQNNIEASWLDKLYYNYLINRTNNSTGTCWKGESASVNYNFGK